MNYRVDINREGRGSQIFYIEDKGRLQFEWDYNAEGVEIYVHPPQEWDNYCEGQAAGWAKGRREEILKRIGQEYIRQRVKNAKMRVEDRWIFITFKRSWFDSLLSKVLN